MRKISMILIVILLFGLIPHCTVLADDGEAFSFFYDFENYKAEVGSGIQPDSNWIFLTNLSGRKNYGSYYDPVENNTAMQIRSSGEPVLMFGRNVTQGKLHISFDIKFSANTRRVLVLFYDGRSGDDATTILTDNYSKTIFLNSPEAGQIRYFISSNVTSTQSMMGWDYRIANINYDALQWHRIDIVTTEISDSKANANYYIDGQLINEYPVYFSSSKGFKSFALRCESLSDSSAPDYVLVDNLSVTRYYGEKGIEGKVIGSDRVPLENAEIEIKLSENINPDMLIPNNIKITNTVSGEEITDFDVVEASANRFKIKFNQKLKSGVHTLMLSSNIRGGVLNSCMLKPVEFRTEYLYEYKYTEFANIDFNDYTYMPNSSTMPEDEDNSTLPHGWRNIGRLEQTYAQSVPGRSGEEKDFALGFVNPAESGVQSRFVYEFPIEIPPETEYSVEFDLLYENMYWYTYLLEPGDVNPDNPNNAQNIAIASTNAEGNIFYAKTRTTSQVTKTDLTVSANEWHTIKLRVIPKSGSVSSVTSYAISVDGGEEYVVDTERVFGTNPTVGIGFGYVPAKDKNGKMYIDNVKVSGNLKFLYPEVDKISFVNYDGKELAAQDEMTSTLYRIIVDFNTVITEESVKRCIKVRQGGKDLNYDYDIESNNGNTTVVIKFDKLLEPSEKYTLNISEDVSSWYSPDVKSIVSYTKSFTSKNDATFKMYENDIEENPSGKIYKVKFVKNNDAVGMYTIAVAGYKTVMRVMDGQEKQMEELTGIKYIPFVVNAESKGVFEYELEIDFNSEYIRTYLWNYPTLYKIENLQ